MLLIHRLISIPPLSHVPDRHPSSLLVVKYVMSVSFGSRTTVHLWTSESILFQLDVLGIVHSLTLTNTILIT